MGASKIEWTDATWNPVHGCTKCSPGCANCYAERMAKRQQAMGTRGYEDGFAATLAPHKLSEPLRWRKPRMIFVCSMGDLFHDDVPFEYIAAVFGVMAACPQHTFQVLTKHAVRMAEFFKWVASGDPNHVTTSQAIERGVFLREYQMPTTWPLPNVWLGVTAEDQQRADERIPLLLQCPASVRFVSVEPMLGRVDLEAGFSICDSHGEPSGPRCKADGSSALDWIICGGESGPGARPMAARWAKDLCSQCVCAGVPFLFKQWGEWLPNWQRLSSNNDDEARKVGVVDGETVVLVGKKSAGRLLDGVLHDAFPEVKS